MTWSNVHPLLQLRACYPALCGFTMKLGGFFMQRYETPPATTTRVAFSLAEVAELLGVSKRVIEGEINAGRLKAIRVGRSLRVTQRAIDKYTGEAT